MNLDELTLRHLRIVEAVDRTRSVSKAAVELGVGQPAVSVGLAKLRKHFNDPLFVRTTNGMAVTAGGARLLDAARQVVFAMDCTLRLNAPFKPATTVRRFGIGVNQVTQTLLLPHISSRMLREAPRCHIDAVAISSDSLRGLETGAMDIAIGNIPGFVGGYVERTVRRAEYVCIASVGHPRIREDISREQFSAERHVLISGLGSIMVSAEEWMIRRKIHRDVAVRVPDFLGADHMVANSDLIATVPRSIALYYARHKKVRVLEHPLPLPHSVSKIYWHERFQRDEGHVWLRSLVAEVIQKHGGSPAGASSSRSAATARPGRKATSTSPASAGSTSAVR